MMNDILLNTDRELNGEEKMYRDRFEEIFSIMPLPLQANEKFAQWLETGDEYRYYNPAFFSSNYGYTISVFNNSFKILKTNLKVGGWKQNKESRWTDYVKSIFPKWEQNMNKGYEPLYYYYINSYPKSRGLVKQQKQAIVHKAIALYHLPNGYLVLDGRYDVHHKISFDWNQAAQHSNMASNLQCLLEDPEVNVKDNPERKQHTFIHNTARNTSQAKIDELKEKSLSPDVPHYVFVQPGGLEKFILSGLRKNPDTAIGVSVKNEDGSTFMNAYYSGSDAKLIDN